MSADNMNDKFWDDVAPGLRRAIGLRPLTQEEAEKAYADAPEAEISESEIEQLLLSARSDIPKERSFGPSSPTKDEALAEDVCEIHRNEGDAEDEEVDDQLDQQRRDALGDDEDEAREDSDGPKES